MEQYVKGFQRFHAGEEVRPVTSCNFLIPSTLGVKISSLPVSMTRKKLRGQQRHALEDPQTKDRKLTFWLWKIVKKCLNKWTECIFWINKSGCYICRMSCQQLNIEEKIQIILYTSGLITIMSLLEAGEGHPKKWPSLGGAWEKVRTEWGGHGNS